MTAVVVPVRTAAQRKAWVDVPGRLYRGRAAYVPQLRSDALAAMSTRRDPLHRHARIRHYLLVRDAEPVGRISTTVHPAYNEKFGKRVGFFGHIDTTPSPHDHQLLLDAAEQCVRSVGMDVIAGPYNYWSGAEFGVLADGHDRPPASFQTWYPPHTLPILEQLGYAARTKTTGFEIEIEGLGAVREALLASSDRIGRSIGVTTRALDRRNLDRDTETVRLLFAQAFAKSAENLDYPPDVFASMVGSMKPFLDHELVRLAVKDGEVIGFSFTIPNLNQVLVRLDGRVRPRDLLRMKRYVREVDQAVVLLVGVQPDAPMGVAHILFADTLRAVEQGGYRTVHTTWVHQDNSTMRGLLTSVTGAVPTRDWVVVEKDLAR